MAPTVGDCMDEMTSFKDVDPHVLRRLVEKYFWQMKTTSRIQRRLRVDHNIDISYRSLQRKFEEYGLKRREPMTAARLLMAVLLILYESNGPKRLLGCKLMHLVLRNKWHFAIRREDVLSIQKHFFFDEHRHRKKRRLHRRTYRGKGPNGIMHIDQYDKLKYFGFPIHACVDGYSRMVFWCRVVPSNNCPWVIAHLWLNCILKEVRGVPRMLFSDPGNENSVVQRMQMMLRWHHHDRHSGTSSVHVVPSTRNQRIESFWGRLRRHCLQYYKALFEKMAEDGDFIHGSTLHTCFLVIVFLPVIQKQMNEFVATWNCHRISKSGHFRCHDPTDVPEDMYRMPDEFGGRDQKHSIDMWLFIVCYLVVRKNNPYEMEVFLPQKFVDVVKPVLDKKFGRITDANAVTAYKWLVRKARNAGLL